MPLHLIDSFGTQLRIEWQAWLDAALARNVFIAQAQVFSAIDATRMLPKIGIDFVLIFIRKYLI